MWAPTRRQVLAGSVVGAVVGTVLLDSPRVTSRPGFLALGDSYTVGTGVSAEDRWPNDHVERMREERVELASPILVAEDGWTTDHLEGAIGERSLDGSYALVTLLIGANDAFRGRPFEIFRPKFVELLTLSLEFAAEPSSVVVMTVPDTRERRSGSATRPRSTRRGSSATTTPSVPRSRRPTRGSSTSSRPPGRSTNGPNWWPTTASTPRRHSTTSGSSASCPPRGWRSPDSLRERLGDALELEPGAAERLRPRTMAGSVDHSSVM
jgi:hypothetical protein